MDTSVFERLESGVRSYCREFPAIFVRATGPYLWASDGRRYLDLLCGAGALNYGHNHPVIRDAVMTHIGRDGVIHSLDLYTDARARFLSEFERIVLKPRDLDYRIQFPGPTGTNAVEAALKLARKVTQRQSVIAFTNAFHGMTLGSLAASATGWKRTGAGVALSHVTRMPFDGYEGVQDTAAYLERVLSDPGSGVDLPAAILLETVQAEGGVRTAEIEWLRAVEATARRHGALLIVDEIQTGCGRTGPFFSFERARLRPDIICLSKSLSALGLPLSAVLIRPEYDTWTPGEHNGTFRGNNLALVAATVALSFWEEDSFLRGLRENCAIVERRLESLAALGQAEIRGLGMLRGIRWPDPSMARAVSRLAFGNGLIAETCGAEGDVLKLLPALNMPPDSLETSFDILEAAAREAMASDGGDGRRAEAAVVRS